MFYSNNRRRIGLLILVKDLSQNITDLDENKQENKDRQVKRHNQLNMFLILRKAKISLIINKFINLLIVLYAPKITRNINQYF